MILADQMSYVAVSKPGGPDAMQLVRGPLPQPKPGEALVRVQAAGVNRPDVQQRLGAYPPPPDASPILGLEIAGEVVVAAGHLKVGDRVCALANGGGYAEYCAVPATQCLPWPEGYDAVRAAALPETFFTVWANLFEMGRLRRGESVLVHGGSSGIGTTAIQLARARGARVYATAGSAAKCDACAALGAVAINYKDGDFAAKLKELTGGEGVDIVLDMVGGPYFQQNLRSLKMDGRLVIIAFLGGPKLETADLLPIMLRRLTVTGSTMRPRTAAQKAAIAGALQREAWPLLDGKLIAPVIHEVFPLAEVAQAHRLMESSAHVGKIVLTL